jgi:hypothetical protein
MSREARCSSGVANIPYARSKLESSSGSGCSAWKWNSAATILHVSLSSHFALMLRMATTLLMPMLAAERHVICWIRALVKEALESLEPSALGLGNDNVETLSPSQLGTVVLHIWARTLSGNSLWPFIRQISNTFEILARRNATTTAN